MDKLRKFEIYWIGQEKPEIVYGKDIVDAFKKAGHGGGSINDVDYYREVKNIYSDEFIKVKMDKSRYEKFKGFYRCRLYQTFIVIWNDEEIRLKTDGFKTATTKRYMNECSKDFDLGFHVYQKNKQWFVDYKNQTIPFTENMKLKR